MPDRTSLLLAALKRHPNLDPQAVLAVARQEGLSGGIGDGGHAFGPFQMNDAGGVWTGRYPGLSPEQKNRIAWTPGAINEALSSIDKVASGQRGAGAVNSIVRRFERPADPNGEVQRALGAASPVAAQPTNPSFGAPATGSNSAFASALIGGMNKKGLLDQSALVRALQVRGGGQPAGTPSARPPVQQGGPLASVDGIQVDPAIAGQVDKVVQMFGVKPSSGYRSPSHNAAVGGASHSDHLSGDAVDFVGSPQQEQALYQWAIRNRIPYVEPMSQAKNHVHLSFKR